PRHLAGAPGLPDRPGRLLHVSVASGRQLAVGAPRRHEAVHAYVHDQVAVVVHVVLDRPEDERPALHLLIVPSLDQLLRLRFRERVPDLGTVVVARAKLLHDLVSGLQLLEPVGARQRVPRYLGEEEVVLPDQVDEVLPRGAHVGRRPEIILVLRNDLRDPQHQAAGAFPGRLGRREETRGGEGLGQRGAGRQEREGCDHDTPAKVALPHGSSWLRAAPWVRLSLPSMHHSTIGLLLPLERPDSMSQQGEEVIRYATCLAAWIAESPV